MSEYGYGYGTHPPNLIYIDGRSSNEANFSPNYGFYGMSIPPTNPYPTNYPSTYSYYPSSKAETSSYSQQLNYNDPNDMRNFLFSFNPQQYYEYQHHLYNQSSDIQSQKFL